MNIQADTEDLALTATDAESVTGGRMWRTKLKPPKIRRHPAPHHLIATLSPAPPAAYVNEPEITVSRP